MPIASPPTAHCSSCLEAAFPVVPAAVADAVLDPEADPEVCAALSLAFLAAPVKGEMRTPVLFVHWPGS